MTPGQHVIFQIREISDSCSSFPMTSLWTFEIFHAFSQNQSLSASLGSTAVSQNTQKGAAIAHETCLSFQWFPCTQQLSERDLFLHNTSFVLALEILNKYRHSNFKTKLLKVNVKKIKTFKRQYEWNIKCNYDNKPILCQDSFVDL